MQAETLLATGTNWELEKGGEGFFPPEKNPGLYLYLSEAQFPRAPTVLND